MAPQRGWTPGSKMERHLRYVAIVSFFLTLIALCLFNVASVDFGWHLKAGEYIWTTKSIPTHDIFSYIAEGQRWVDSHWLFQLILYGVHDVGGILGVVLLRVTLVVATFALLFWTICRKEYLAVTLFVCLLALFTSYQRFVIRPELVSFFFLAAFVYCTEHFSERPRLYLIVIPLCQAVWANMHGLHALGVIFLGLYVAGDALQLLAARFLPGFPNGETTARELAQKGILFVLVCLALLVNANGIDGILYPYTIFSELRGEVTLLQNLSELRSPFFFTAPSNLPTHPLAAYKAFLFVSILASLGQLRRIRFAHTLPYLAFLYLSILAIRNMPLFAIVAAPMTIRNLNASLDSFLARRGGAFASQRRAALTTALSMLVLAAGIWTATTSNQLYARMHWLRTFGVGALERVPTKVVAHLRSVDGNFFNSPDIGGYLIWRLYPQKQVAVDGRWEVYGSSLPEVLSAYRSPAAFSKLAAKHNISTVVLSRGSDLSKLMTPWLDSSETWELTVRTRETLVFERSER